VGRDVEETDELAIGPKAALTAILRVAETVTIYALSIAHTRSSTAD
jgi:hypothetical protein